MTKWAVIFDDTPAMLTVRQKMGSAHVDYINAHADRILIGGGLRLTSETPFVGGLWIVTAETYEEVLELVENDPYFVPEHRRFKIFAWNKASDQDVTL